MANIAPKPELNNYQQWQLEKYGNILPPNQTTLFTAVYNPEFDEMHRLEEWVSMQEELQLIEKEVCHD